MNIVFFLGFRLSDLNAEELVGEFAVKMFSVLLDMKLSPRLTLHIQADCPLLMLVGSQPPRSHVVDGKPGKSLEAKYSWRCICACPGLYVA